MPHKYSGLFGRKARRRCPHSNLEGLFGDHILWSGGWRLFCRDCERFLDGPVILARLRAEYKERTQV